MLFRTLVVLAAVLAFGPVSSAQDTAAPTPAAPQPTDSSAIPEAPAPPPAELPPPPPGYAATADTSAAPATQGQANPPTASTSESDRRRFNIWLGLGGGDAVGCGEDGPCAVDGAFAVALGADYRIHPNFGVGLEISGWSFSVSDRWLGQLSGEQKSAEIGASSLSLIGRWYWFDHGIADPYLQFGVGPGSIEASVTNDAEQTYTYKASGFMWNLGIGGDFHVTPWFKLGPQLLAGLLVGNEICETEGADGEPDCREPRKDEMGEEEGRALAWRLMIVGTVMLGER